LVSGPLQIANHKLFLAHNSFLFIQHDELVAGNLAMDKS
jgi:hypothetical protein